MLNFNRKRFVQGPNLNDEIQSYSTTSSAAHPVSTSSGNELGGAEVRKIYEDIIKEPPSKIPKISPLPLEPKKSIRKRPAPVPVKKKSTSDIMKMCESNSAAELEEYMKTFGGNFVLNIRDQWNWTPLMTAGASGSLDVVKLLLSYGANTKLKESSGKTVLELCKKNKQFGIYDTILEWERRQSSMKSEEDDDDDDCVILDDGGPGPSGGSRNKNNPDYCDICKTNFCNDKTKHENSIAHLVSSGPGNLDDKIHYGIPESNRGFQLMLRSGWGRRGLGPLAEGQKFPVKTILKRDRKGLGDGSNLEAKITHFKPFDTDAVVGIRRARIERISTVKKKEQQHNRNREKRKEIHLRRQLNGL